MKGIFIVIEGLDGSGTTTQAKLLAEYLFEKDKRFVPLLTREPTMLNDYGKEIRRRLKHQLLPGEEVIHDSEYWTNLYVKDREWHLENVVQPNMEKGLIIISDRHMLSTLAYQSAQGADINHLTRLHQQMLKPNLTIFLRVPLETALQRIGIRDKGEEFFERKDFLQKTCQAYEEAIKLVQQEQNIVVIDGTLSIEEIAKLIQKEIEKIITLLLHY